MTVFYLVEMWGRIPLLLTFHLQYQIAGLIVFGELLVMTGLQITSFLRATRLVPRMLCAPKTPLVSDFDFLSLSTCQSHSFESLRKKYAI